MNNMLNSMKEYEKNLKKESAEYLAIENAQLKEQIDKAIEYIKGWQNFSHTNENTHKELRNLLEILKGE